MGDDSSRITRFAPLAFAGAFCLLGLLTLDAYGPSWDEPLHRSWGEAGWNYLRTGDESLITGMAGAGRHYGPLFYMLDYATSTFLHDVAGLDFTPANHVLTLVTASIGVAVTFLLAARLVSTRVAFVATTLLVLMPSFRAHAQYNPKDIPLLTLVATSLLFATFAWRSRRATHAALAGAFLGIALAMKPTAFILVPVLTGALIADLLPPRRNTIGDTIRLASIAAAASALALFASWPALWRHPSRLIDAIAYFARGGFWTGNVLYFGALFPAADLPWHYTPVMLALTLPAATLPLATAGAVALLHRGRNPAVRFPAALLLLWIILPVLMFLKPGLARYDGMRQLFFIVPALAILAGAGWEALWLNLRPARKPLLLAASGLLVLWLCIDGVRAFPYGGSWFNAPARALLGPHLEQRFEIEYWGVSYREGIRWLNRFATPNSSVCTPVANRILEWQTAIVRSDISFDCSDPDYVMLMTRFSEWPWQYESYRNATPIFTVSRFGSDLLYVVTAD